MEVNDGESGVEGAVKRQDQDDPWIKSFQSVVEAPENRRVPLLIRLGRQLDHLPRDRFPGFITGLADRAREQEQPSGEWPKELLSLLGEKLRKKGFTPQETT